MATLSLADLVLSTFSKGLDVFAHILARAKEDAEERGIDVESLVEARIVEDQNPLSFQVHFASQVVRNNLGRLAGEEATPLESELKTFADLQKHIQDTIEILKSFNAEKAKGREGTEVNIRFRSQEHAITLQEMELNHALPNLFFHLTTAYSILRVKGVPLGKKDYLGGFLGK
ncbi:hypothetical protein PFICI_04756 [Pestalotiopsis fici W106-1]|uniref:DUF1993 domain-containing protein n=1 Tax=Pestalotiopsis fici (strain W106-1 / CGMCC3.15140) TaxID=1229662 RepID=W3X9Z4_PESFW|nr:uncharacterized protein PFICI_04756 [Pestalotiopsis fici W106-1]ETS82880.1 hypothetical protein PFICI_04756 [Pestalotiopsis fici W106-1]